MPDKSHLQILDKSINPLRFLVYMQTFPERPVNMAEELSAMVDTTSCSTTRRIHKLPF